MSGARVGFSTIGRACCVRSNRWLDRVTLGAVHLRANDGYGLTKSARVRNHELFEASLSFPRWGDREEVVPDAISGQFIPQTGRYGFGPPWPVAVVYEEAFCAGPSDVEDCAEGVVVEGPLLPVQPEGAQDVVGAAGGRGSSYDQGGVYLGPEGGRHEAGEFSLGNEPPALGPEVRAELHALLRSQVDPTHNRAHADTSSLGLTEMRLSGARAIRRTMGHAHCARSSRWLGRRRLRRRRALSAALYEATKTTFGVGIGGFRVLRSKNEGVFVVLDGHTVPLQSFDELLPGVV